MTTQAPDPWNILTAAQLQALGLDEDRSEGEIQALALPVDDNTSTHALAPSNTTAQAPLRTFFEEDGWLDTIEELDWSEPLPLAAAQNLGLGVMRARDRKGIWFVQCPHGLLDVYPSTSKQNSPGYQFDPNDQGVVYLDMDALGNAVRLESESGAMILMVHQNQCLAFELPFFPLLQEPPIRTLNPALDVWLQDCTDDWLIKHLHRYKTGMSWDNAISASLYGRLCQHNNQTKKRAVAHILNGTLDPKAHAPWAWAASLSNAEVDDLIQLFIQARALLQEEMLNLGLTEENDDDLPFHDPQWVRQWHDCLHQRDDLEAVACLLRHHPSEHSVLNTALEHIDRAGRLFAASLPLFDEIVGDERLLRAYRTAPGLWWTFPAVEDM